MARSKKTPSRGKGSKGQNKASGEAFLDKNAKKPNVVISETGLQYEIINSGDENKPDEFATVKLSYRVGLINGKIFSDTYQRCEFREYKLNEVIDGLSEGLQKIGKSGKVKLVIPPELAWSNKGIGEHVGPNAVIIWTAELVDWW